MTNEQLDALIAQARNTKMTDADRETQRQSFAYGNAHFENEHITRATVKRESEKLREEQKDESR
jgi:hypothetical protein